MDDEPRRAKQRPAVALCSAKSVDLTYICDLPPGHNGRMHRDSKNSRTALILWSDRVA